MVAKGVLHTTDSGYHPQYIRFVIEIILKWCLCNTALKLLYHTSKGNNFWFPLYTSLSFCEWMRSVCVHNKSGQSLCTLEGFDLKHESGLEAVHVMNVYAVHNG